VIAGWSNEVGAAGWILGRLHPFGSDLGSIVPDGFEAYARILNPAYDKGGAPVRLSELAGAALDATTRLDDLAAAAGVKEPIEGTLDRGQLDALVETLARFTTTPDRCWFGVWTGFGWLGPQTVERPRRVVELPERPMGLYEGPIGAAAAFMEPPGQQSPNLWWPADRAWCVATEIDFRSTYLGGAEALVRAVLEAPGLDAIRVSVADRVTD
jgi:hypothetical protein